MAAWPILAAQEITRLRQVLPAQHLLDIQHIGSTTIPGTWAKPMIDIQIAMDSLTAIKTSAIESLKQLSYQYRDENPDTTRLFFVKGMPSCGEKRETHVHIVEPTSKHWQDKLRFRDYLLAHPEVAHDYTQLKKTLSEQCLYDREQYTPSKTSFIEAVLQINSTHQRFFMKQRVVITGCSGGGKSTLIAALKKRGYLTVPESGRIILKETLAIGGDLTPWQRPSDFCAAIIQHSVAAYQEKHVLMASQEGQYCFFDRCFLDAVSYFHTLTRPDVHQYDHLISSMRFYPIVFIVPPWPEIYCQDDERKHGFHEAIAEYERLMAFYPQYGYQLVEVPKMGIEERVDFFLLKLNLL